MLTVEDRAEISAGMKARLTIRAIAAGIGRAASVVSREVRRNSTGSGSYRAATANSRARELRSRPQSRLIDSDPVLGARVLADLRSSRTPRQIAGRLQLEAADRSVELMDRSIDAQGRTVSHDAIYRWIYGAAVPTGEVLDEGQFPATAAGLERAVAWVARRTDADPAALWVIEGVGTYGARLARTAAHGGYTVVEAPRMNARANRGIGKSDPLDARRIAQAAIPLDDIPPR